MERTLQGFCFVLFCCCYACQGLLIIKIIICIYYLIVSSPQAVRPTTLSFHLSVNMYVLNVKSYTDSECDKGKKGIKKAFTGLDSVPVIKTISLISCEMAQG